MKKPGQVVPIDPNAPSSMQNELTTSGGHPIKGMGSNFTEKMSLSVQFARENRIVSRVQLYGTALLCMFDMVTDIFMVVKYIESKQYGFAKATLM